MPLHQDLLCLSNELVDRNPAAPVDADLRRGVSTAYYAIFHLLVYEGTARLVSIAALRPRVARAFDHRIMKTVCQEYAKLTLNPAGQFMLGGQSVPQQIKDIASAFIALQEARHQADYDTAVVLKQAQAQTHVLRAEVAFLDWQAVQADPAASAFLAELLYRGIPRR